ncbi:MAG: prephenate dehydrogenase/arogenate dehydrogenase family protein [Bdellovibrio sp.]
MKIGIIGFGRLGKLAAQNLAQDSDLSVFDIKGLEAEIKAVGAKARPLAEVAASDIVLPIVPISELKATLNSIKNYIKPGALVIDVCSVKEAPVQWMKEILPSHCEILGTHPMFGPDSAKLTLYGSKIVLCPVRINEEKLKNIDNYLQTHGLHTITCTPTEHDKQIAHSLILTHFVGRGLVEFGASDLEIDTKGYRRLMKILETVVNDSWQLFEDMNHYNKYAKEMREQFIKSLQTIDHKVRT